MLMNHQQIAFLLFESDLFKSRLSWVESGGEVNDRIMIL